MIPIKLSFLVFLFLGISFYSFSQNENLLLNPSFEGSIAKTGQVPLNWHNEGFPNASPTDIHSKESRFFGVNTAPFHGDTYLGMVTRSNKTWEAIGQKLARPLLKDSSYLFSVYLARSESHRSYDQNIRQQAHFITPVRLRVWARNDKKESFFLGQTPLVEHTNWRKYEIGFVPEMDYVEVVLEVYYGVSKKEAYNGNVLVDGCFLEQVIH